MSSEKETLEGGRPGRIHRAGNAVHRPAGPWTPHVQALLRYIRAQGFTAAPEPIGFDDAGNEIVSYLPGEVCDGLTTPAAASTEALTSAAGLLRSYHLASASFVPMLMGEEVWMLPTRQPVEVICHGDYAPYNLVLEGNRAVGVFDFDAAHPGPRAWDIAYAVYRWAPLTRPEGPNRFGSQQEKIDRARLFCDAYGLADSERAGLVDLVIERLLALVTFMKEQASAGNEAFQADIADGHHRIYLADSAYLKQNVDRIQVGLVVGSW